MANSFDQFDAPASPSGQANPFDKFDAPAAKPVGFVRKAADLGLGFASGALGATKSVSDAAGAGNAVSSALDSADKFVQSGLSDQAVADQQAQQAILKESRGKGIIEGVKSAGRAFAVAPVQSTVTGIGSIVPTLAAGLATGGASVPVSLGARAAMGVAQGAGSIKGSIYDDIKQRSAEAKMDPVAAESAALKAQEYGGPNTGQIALGAALGIGDSVTGVSKIANSMIRKSLSKGAQEAAEGSTRGIVARTALGAAGEVPLEAAQGGQQQYASNVASQREGFAVNPWDNVVSQGAFEGLASAGPGAAFGALHGRAAPIAPEAAPSAIPGEPAPAPESTPPGLGFNPGAGTHTVFPDGSVILNSDRPEGEQAVFDKRFAPQAGTAAAQDAPAATFASILDTDPVYSTWSNVQDGTDRAIMRDQMEYVGRTYAGKATDENREALNKDLSEQFKWFRNAAPEQKNAALDSLFVQPAAAEPTSQIDTALSAAEANIARTRAEWAAAEQRAKRIAVVGVADAPPNSPLTSAAFIAVDSGAHDEAIAQQNQALAQAGKAQPTTENVAASPLTAAAESVQAPAAAPAAPTPQERLAQLNSEIASGTNADTGAKLTPFQLGVRKAQANQIVSQLPKDASAGVQPSNDAPSQAPQAQAAIESVASTSQGIDNGTQANETQPQQPKPEAAAAAVAGAADEVAPSRNYGDRLPPEKAMQLQEASRVFGRDVTRQQVQSMRDRVAGEVVSGQTNNGGVMANLKPAAITQRKEQLGRLDHDLALFDGTAPQPETSAAPARPANWQANRIAAGKVASDMGISIAGMKLAEVVAAVQRADAATTPKAESSHLGRNNQPLSEGGKPYKTRLAAAEAKKLQPMMRVVAVKDGFVLAEKTEKQVAAEAKAARRLRNPQTSAPGEPIPAHAFIAAEGGLHKDTRPDMNIGANPKIGNRTLFAGKGKGISMERATARLIEEGYLSEGASQNEAAALIKQSLTRPQYNADGIERIAIADEEARYAAYELEMEEVVVEAEALDNNEFDSLDSDIPWNEPGTSSSYADFLRATGATEQEIQDEITNDSGVSQAGSESSGRPDEVTPGQAQAGDGQRAPEAQSVGEVAQAVAGSVRENQPASQSFRSPSDVPPAPGVYKMREGTFARFDHGIWWRAMPTARKALLTEFAGADQMRPENRYSKEFAWTPYAEIYRRAFDGEPSAMRVLADKAGPSQDATNQQAPAQGQDEGLNAPPPEFSSFEAKTALLKTSPLLVSADGTLNEQGKALARTPWGSMDAQDRALVQKLSQDKKSSSDTYNDKIRVQEREIERRQMQENGVIQQANGKPFKTEASAKARLDEFDLSDTHKIAPALGGFVLRQMPPAEQAEVKRKAEGRESYTEAQDAVLREMGIDATSEDGEIDATEAQWAEIDRRTNARLRGAPDTLTAPSQQDVIDQQARTEQAAQLDEKAQIDREASKQTLTRQAAPEQRTDTSGDMFAMEKATAEIEKRNAGVAAAKDPNQGAMFSRPARSVLERGDSETAEILALKAEISAIKGRKFAITKGFRARGSQLAELAALPDEAPLVAQLWALEAAAAVQLLPKKPVVSGYSQAQVDSPAFRRWFGKDGIRDDEGKPKIFTHSGDPGLEVISGDKGRFNGIFVLPGQANARYRDKTYHLYMKGLIVGNPEIQAFFDDSPEDAAAVASEALGKSITADEMDKVQKLVLSEVATDEDAPILNSYDAAEGYAAMQRVRGAIAKHLGATAVKIDDEFGGDSLLVVDGTKVKSTENNGDFDPANPNIRYSRQDQPTTGTAKTVRTALAKRFGLAVLQLEKRGVLKIWDSAEQFNAAAQPSRRIQGAAQGMWDGKVAHLFADGIEPGREVAVLLHEVGEHASMKQMLGDKAYARLVARAYELALDGNPLAQAALERIPNDTNPRHFDSELLAYMIEIVAAQDAKAAPSARKWLADVVAAIRAWWSQTGFAAALAKAGIRMELTPKDISALAVRAVKWQARQESDGQSAGSAPMFSRASAIGDTLKAITVTDLKAKAGNRLSDYRNLGLQFLGGRQINDIYGKDIPQLPEYTRMVQQMSADANEVGANADQVATSWGKLKDERQLAELMHDATLAQIDPAKAYVPGDNRLQWGKLNAAFKALSTDAQKVYTDARDGYEEHYANVREAIRDKIERSAMNSEAKAAMLERMDGEFFEKIKGVYFPLARFGKYVVLTRNATGEVVNVSRAETMNEAEALRIAMRKAYPGHSVGKVLKDKEFNAARDSVGRGFLKDLFGVLDKEGVGAELQDAVNQLYLASMPDLSWAKHGIHRKGTPGFSQDARRAYAQNMFHGARYLAKLRYADQLQDKLQAMQEHVGAQADTEAYDSVKGQQIVDEMNKRHDSLMNPKSNPLSTALTSFGFVFHLGLSPASALVNLSQTALVAYPIMGAKWGFDKAAAALAVAGKQAATNKNDISSALTPDERQAYDKAVNAGTIDVTNAHDLAGIAQGEDAGIMWKVRPIMKWASFMFHHAERFNRQVTFVASYRLARAAGTEPDAAFEQATKATYDGHFDYAASNRPRFMQGNVAKVVLLFKQYATNMIYTMTRQAQLAINAENPADRREARRALGSLLTMHAAAAGVLGLPMVTTLLAAASMLGGSDDEPWDAETALRNTLAESFGQKPAEVMARGFSRLTPWDISGRVGLDKLIFPDVQEGLAGQRWAESAMAAALGPVAGIGVNMLKGMQSMADGDYARGLESMLPAALRGPMKALRYGQDGNVDKSGVVINDQVSAAGVLGQAMGFSPSETRSATEGRSAIFSADKRLGERRAELMGQFAKAFMQKDVEATAEARADIAAFNEKNPTRRINPMQMMQSVRGRQKRIDQAKDGVYLSKNHQDARTAGNFALAE